MRWYLLAYPKVTAALKYQFIFERYVRYSIEDQCHVLSVSRAGYYRWRRQEIPRRQRENWELLKQIRKEFAQHRYYGSPRVTKRLHQIGLHVSRKRVARLMRQDGLSARKPRRFVRTTKSDHLKASPNLLKRKFKVPQPGTVCLCDITYVPTGEGTLYEATVMDACTRKIVGLAMSHRMTNDLTIQALRQAIQRQAGAPGELRPNMIVHSDRGSQYSSNDYRKLLTASGFRQSMSRKGNCWDNAPAESLFKTLKHELTDDERYTTREDARRSIFEFVEIYYNRQRMHSAINYQTPSAFEATFTTSITASKPKSTVY